MSWKRQTWSCRRARTRTSQCDASFAACGWRGSSTCGWIHVQDKEEGAHRVRRGTERRTSSGTRLGRSSLALRHPSTRRTFTRVCVSAGTTFHARAALSPLVVRLHDASCVYLCSPRALFASTTREMRTFVGARVSSDRTFGFVSFRTRGNLGSDPTRFGFERNTVSQQIRFEPRRQDDVDDGDDARRRDEPHVVRLASARDEGSCAMQEDFLATLRIRVCVFGASDPPAAPDPTQAGSVLVLSFLVHCVRSHRESRTLDRRHAKGSVGTCEARPKGLESVRRGRRDGILHPGNRGARGWQARDVAGSIAAPAGQSQGQTSAGTSHHRRRGRRRPPLRERFGGSLRLRW